MRVRMPKKWNSVSPKEATLKLVMLVLKSPRGEMTDEDVLKYAYHICKPYMKEDDES